MEVLSCKTPDMIEKEIWIYLLAHNLIRMSMAEAASLSDLLPRQLSFKHSLQLWRIWRQQPGNPNDSDSLNILLLLMLENTVGNRPGRVEPRAIKRRRNHAEIIQLTCPGFRFHIRVTIRVRHSGIQNQQAYMTVKGGVQNGTALSLTHCKY